MGLIITFFAARFLLRWNVVGLATFFALTLALHHLVLTSGNQFDLSTMTAFQPAVDHLAGVDEASWWRESALLQVLGVAAAHALYCLPYVALAGLVVRLLPAVSTCRTRVAAAGVALTVFLCATLFHLPVPAAVTGFSLLVFGALISEWMPGAVSRLALTAGAYSFGIYLGHQMILQLFQLVLPPYLNLPVGVLWLLGFSVATYAAMWMVLAIVRQSRSDFLATVFGFSR